MYRLEDRRINIKLKKWISALLIICFMLPLPLFCDVSSASDTDSYKVIREAPKNFTEGKTTDIKLKISGSSPYFIGIVEELPNGFKFPENDSEVTSAEYSEIDRKSGKISFSVNNEKEVVYKIIPDKSGEGQIKGYWVDLLYQTPKLNEGKERWIKITDPNYPDANDEFSEKGKKTNEGRESPGFGTVSSIFSIFILFVLRRKKTRTQEQ